MKINCLSKIFFRFIAVTFAFANSLSFGASYYFDYNSFHSAGVNMNLSDTLDYWYTDSSLSAKAANLDFLYSGKDSIYFKKPSSTSTNLVVLNFDKSVNFGSLDDGSIAYSAFKVDSGASLTVQGDTIIGNWTSIISGSAFDFKGNLVIKQWGFSIGNTDKKLESLRVAGTTSLLGGSPTVFCVSELAGHSIDNPDAIFASEITLYSSTSMANLTYGASSSSVKVTGTSFAWVNGVSKSVGFAMGGNASSTGALNLVFTNTSSQISSGDFSKGVSGGVISLIMRSSTSSESGYVYLNHSQSFTGSEMVFTGGVQMISGALYLNYNATTGANSNHGTLTLSKAATAQATTFGNSSDTVGGSFLFSNLVVSDSGGAIRVRMSLNETSDALVYDALSFTGSATGTGVVVIDLKNFNGNNPDEMLDFMIDQNLTIKVISWSALADSGIEFTTTDGYKTYNFNGQDYIFNAVNAADGLYINYIPSVPEPAVVAAFLGALALAFAAWRRNIRFG